MKNLLLAVLLTVGTFFTAEAQRTIYQSVPQFTAEYNGNHTAYTGRGIYAEASIILEYTSTTATLERIAGAQAKGGYQLLGVKAVPTSGIDMVIGIYYNASKKVYKFFVLSNTMGGKTLGTLGFARSLDSSRAIGYLHGYLMASL